MPPGGWPGPEDRSHPARRGRWAGATGAGRGSRLLSLARRLPLAGIAVAAALLPQIAFAHARLIESDPAPDAVLQAPPAALSLIFTEPVTPAGAGIKVFSPSGHQVAAPPVQKGSVLSARISSSETGTYIVSWQVLAADTHPSRGAFRFVVGQPSSNPYSVLLGGGQIGTATPLGFGLQALGRWVHFVGFALVFGVVAYQVLIGRKQRFGRLVGAGVILLIAAEPVALLGQLASLSFDGDTAIAVLGSGFGRLLGLRLAAALLVWALWAIESPWPVLGIGAGVALVDGAGAHAIPGLPGAGEVLDVIHVSAMGLWVGGLAAFLQSPHRRFGRYALAAFVAAAVSGLLLAVGHFGVLTALMTSEYGQVLMVKLLVVGAALSLALLRRHRVELGVLVTIVAAAALLASLPPPR